MTFTLAPRTRAPGDAAHTHAFAKILVLELATRNSHNGASLDYRQVVGWAVGGGGGGGAGAGAGKAPRIFPTVRTQRVSAPSLSVFPVPVTRTFQR
jgi:hypothetical protein